jgi:hypothetical protein
MSESRNKIQSTQGVCCLWLLVGFTGAVMAAAGLVSWFDGDAGRLITLTRVFSGAALAMASWRCGRIALNPSGQAPLHETNVPAEPTHSALSSRTEHAHDFRLGAYPVAIRSQTR